MKRKIKITGDCFESALDMFLSDTTGTMILVHGLAKGRGGDASKIKGTYPHAWIEFPNWGIVYDTVAKATVSQDRYYSLGQIGYTKRYTREDVANMLTKHGQDSIVWDNVLIRRAKKITKMRI